MKSLKKMLKVLRLFQADKLDWTVEEMVHALGYPQATVYRYVKALNEEGLLISVPGVGYTLGPRIVELDYILRISDPLIKLGRPFMLELVKEFPCYAMMFRYYQHKILCVHQERGGENFVSSHVRGMPSSLERGAAANVILAHLNRQKLQRLLDTPSAQAKTELPSDAGLLQGQLSHIKANGFAVTHGELTPGVCGTAVPIIDHRKNVVGSLLVSMPEKYATDPQLDQVVNRLKFCARVINTSLAPSDNIQPTLN